MDVEGNEKVPGDVSGWNRRLAENEFLCFVREFGVKKCVTSRTRFFFCPLSILIKQVEKNVVRRQTQ